MYTEQTPTRRRRFTKHNENCVWFKICDFDSVNIYKSARAKKAFLCAVQGF
jgi:hypothetical protein